MACNTASATALDTLAHEFALVPVLGVLEPGAVAACRATRTGHIVVIATESTVRGGAYEAAIRYQRPTAVVTSRACPLLVALAEEAWTEGAVVDGVVHRYLDGLFDAARGEATPDTLLLGFDPLPGVSASLKSCARNRAYVMSSSAATSSACARRDWTPPRLGDSAASAGPSRRPPRLGGRASEHVC